MSFGQSVLLGVSGLATVFLFQWYNTRPALDPLAPNSYLKWSTDFLFCHPPFCPACPKEGYFRSTTFPTDCAGIGAVYNDKPSWLRGHCDIGDKMYFACRPEKKAVAKIVV